MNTIKLIMLYGFAASGKTTLANKYTAEHPLSIAIEGDSIIEMIGQWRGNQDTARKLVFEHTKSIIQNHLLSGYDVVLPYLLTDTKHADDFEQIANESQAQFIEIYLKLEKLEAINRLLQRGVWGEVDSPKLTHADMPEITLLYDAMEKAMTERAEVKVVHPIQDDISETYKRLFEALS